MESILKGLNPSVRADLKLPTDSDLHAVETEHGLTLPETYRQFLKHYSNLACPAIVFGTEHELCIERFHGFPITLGKHESLCFDNAYTTPDAISIGEDIFGNQFLMFLTPNMMERIYYYESDGEGGDFQEDDSWLETGLSFDDLYKYDNSETKPQAFINLTFLAQNFMAFLKLLRPANAG